MKRSFASIVQRTMSLYRPDPARRSVVLAPMVRSGELPTRLVSLKYGADLVWTPEIVDRAIIGTKRIWNEAISCFDYIKGEAEDGAGKVLFRTKPSVEKEKVIFQIGSADPDLAVQAAKTVIDDVAGIDLNSGCPKHFSIHAGMGAGLLRTPDKLVNILERLVNDVGKPNSKPISVKIRLLEPHVDTIALVERLAKTGISHLTVHCRTTPMRPRQPAIRDVLADIAKTCHENNITCYANGDVEHRKHAEQLCEEYGVDGCMIARAAEANPSVFLESGPLDRKEVATEYLKAALEVRNVHANTKFMLARLLPGKHPYYLKITASKTNKDLCETFGVEYNVYEDPVYGRGKGKAKRKSAEMEEQEATSEKPFKKVELSSGNIIPALLQDAPTAQASLSA